MASRQYLELEERLAARDPAAREAIVALAESGDPDAEFKTAEFRLRGIAGPVDLGAAHALMASAAAKGHVAANRAHAYFVAAGIGCDPDPATARAMLERLAGKDAAVADQLRFLGQMTCEQRVGTADRRMISADPYIELVVGLFSPAECQYVQQLAEPALEPAMVYSATGQGIRDPHRDSDNMVIAPMTEDLVVQTINRCIAAASGTDYSWGEPLHVLRYRPGQQYRPHYDAHAFGPVKQRRLATGLLYLNDSYSGGETSFPKIGITVRGDLGDLLIFHNLTPEGEPDARMIHAGLPVTSGEKWLATRWIRGSDFFGRA